MSNSPIYDKLARAVVRKHVRARVTTHWGLFYVNIEMVGQGWGSSWGMFKTAAQANDSARRACVGELIRHGREDLA